jgi:D-alanine-D-alanine ligase
MSFTVDPEWWKTLFDDIYLLTDARTVCDEEITRREVDLVCELLPLRPEHRILDLCGGQGRHSFELHSRGYQGCTLLDYSSYLIDHARGRAAAAQCRIEVIQADARHTGLPSDYFDHVIIMGNSLGYLPDPGDDREILAEANRVLRAGGWLLIDVVDPTVVSGSLNPVAWHEIGVDTVVCRQRETHGDRVCARELVLSKQRGLVRDRTYSIRLFDGDTLQALLEHAGFEGISILSGFSSHRMKGDYGCMDQRMVGTCRKR